jgi:hypothetical protein
MRARVAGWSWGSRVSSVGLALVLIVSAVGCGGERTPGAELDGLGTTWRRVQHDDAVFGAEGEGYVTMAAVTAGGPGYVAVGSVATDDPADPTVAAVWTSTDGRAWTRVPNDDGVFGSDRWTSMRGVTQGGPGLVAVGIEYLPTEVGVGVVWTSTDGLAWTRVADEEFSGTDDTYLADVTAGGPGLVAVGMIREAYDESSAREDTGLGDAPEEQGSDDEGGVDGQEGRDDEPPPSPDEEEEQQNGALGDDDPPPPEDGERDDEPLEDEQEWLDEEGRLDGEEDPDLMMEEMESGPREIAAVWTSEDGRTWTRVPHDDATFATVHTQSMSSVSTGGPGLVAVGTARREVGFGWAAAAWTSEDGVTWTRLPHEEDIFGGDGMPMMSAVTAGGPGVVAVGGSHWSYRDPEQGWFAAAWTSADGLRWERAPHDEEAFESSGYPLMADVVAVDTELVAVGAVFELTDEEFVTRMVGAVWTSEDGLRWTRLPHDEAVFGGADEVTLGSVAAGPSGLVAVGTVGFDAANGPPGSTVAAVWTSP